MAEVRDAALTLFANEGYAGTNMSDIARAVDLVAPSLYNHIASKSELLRELCVSAMHDLLGLQEEALGKPDVTTQLRTAAELHVTYCATRRREVIVTAREFIHLGGPARQQVLDLRHRYERGFRSLIEQGSVAGVFDVERPKLASYAIIEMGLAVAEWYRERGPYPVAAVATDYGRFALRLVGHHGDGA